MSMGKVTRRQMLVGPSHLAAAAAIGSLSEERASGQGSETEQPVAPKASGGKSKRVVALVTEYRFNSHADVLVGKILEGYRHDGGARPALELAGMYVDQFPKGDLSRALSRRHNFPIFPTIEE